MQRDNLFNSDDYVKIAFDTFARQRDGYFFMVNAAGARPTAFRKILGRGSRLRRALDGARTHYSDGWVAEIAIPFKSISFDPRHDFWRMNIERVIRHKQETVRWTGISRAKSVTAPEDFGELRSCAIYARGSVWNSVLSSSVAFARILSAGAMVLGRMRDLT